MQICQRSSCTIFIFLFFTSFFFNQSVFGAPYTEDKTVKITGSPSSTAQITAADIIAERNKIPGWQLWHGSDRDQILKDGAKRLTSYSEILKLVNETGDTKVRQEILDEALSRIGSNSSLQDIMQVLQDPNVKGTQAAFKLVSDAFKKFQFEDFRKYKPWQFIDCCEANDKFLLEIADKVKDPKDLVSIAKSAYLKKTCNQVLAKGVQLSPSFEDLYQLTINTYFGKGLDEEKELAKAAVEKASSISEALRIADLRYGDSSVRYALLVEIAGKFAKNVDDIATLSWRMTGNNAGLIEMGKKFITDFTSGRKYASLISGETERETFLQEVRKFPPPTATDSSSLDGLISEVYQKYGIIMVDSPAGKWKPEEIKFVLSCLESLPPFFRMYTKTLRREGYNGNLFFSTLGYMYQGHTTVHLTSGAMEKKSQWKTLVHEMTHVFADNNPEIGYKWEKTFWKDGAPIKSSVSDYGNSKPTEDLPESVKEYWANGPHLKKSDPERYEFIRTNIMHGVEYPTPMWNVSD
ncbi:MAG: hypothetical protein HQM08_05735 [Candidatus Riflebacteria bacterium]|nr:hypothetical protein [Candidatus Riflebacteria bacterium]